MTVRNLNFDTINSAIGELMIVASEKNITQILWQEQFDDLLSHQQLIFNQSQVHHPLIESAKQQLLAYFERTLKCFKLPLSPQGTTFQKQSWHALQQIP